MNRLAPFAFAGSTSLVTGAASGIGEHLARQLAARGSELVLVDVAAERLAVVAAEIRAANPGISVDAVVADLADSAAIEGLVAGVLVDHPRITLLVNNAGVAMAGEFSKLTPEEFDWVMRVNFDAPVLLTHFLLPTLMANPGSHIVNVSSVFGLIAPAGQSAYSASKFALRGFSESLRAELTPRGVGVTTVHPGGVRTSIAENARIAAAVPAEQVEAGRAALAKLLKFPADRAAAQILAGVQRRRARVLISISAKGSDLMARAAPVGHATLVSSLLGRGRRRRRA